MDTLTPEEIELLKELVALLGEVPVAKACGAARGTFARAVAGFRLNATTAIAIRVRAAGLAAEHFPQEAAAA